MSAVLINIDVPDLQAATRFYVAAFGLRVSRRISENITELLGLPSPIYLLEKAEGTMPFAGAASSRDYTRHWSPVHLDIVVDHIEEAAEKAKAAGGRPEGPIQTAQWGKMALFSDPFGNGFCLVQFLGRGYDEITLPPEV